jgi:hypothetical protein
MTPRFSQNLRKTIASTLIRRLTFSLIAVILAGLGVVLFFWDDQPWHRLSNGGEVRLEKIEYTDWLTISAPSLRLDGLRGRLGPTFSRLLGPYPSSGTAGFGAPTFVAAFAFRGFPAGMYTGLGNARCEIDLPGAQTLQGQGQYVGGFSNIELVTFSIAPFAEKRLKMRLVVNGETIRFDVRNPAYSRKRQAWKAEPLPQSRTVDGLEFTLKRIDAVWSSNEWGVDTEFAVQLDGKDVRQWVNCRATICDPLGNEASSGLFSEPVWKVRCTAVRNNRYPYPDSQIEWLGPDVRAAGIARGPNRAEQSYQYQ